MEKFVLKSTGEEIKMGEKIVVSVRLSTPLGASIVPYEVSVNKNTLPKLIEAGILKSVKNVEEFNSLSIDFYIEKIAKKMGMTFEDTYHYLNKLLQIYPASVFSLLLKEIAITLDKQYKGHIGDCSKVWIFSTLTGSIIEVDTNKIVSFKNFAAFRTKEDIQVALVVLEKILNYMFKDEGE